LDKSSDAWSIELFPQATKPIDVIGIKVSSFLDIFYHLFSLKIAPLFNV
jgi:hypothetical protein